MFTVNGPGFPLYSTDRTYSISASVGTAVLSGGSGMRKFVNTLPGLCGVSPWGTLGANELGQCMPVATPDTATFPGSDYYEISLVQYNERMHSDLPAAGTTLRGYVQTNLGPRVPHYLGPAIVAQKNRPVRIKFTNTLSTGTGGDLFIPLAPARQ